MRGISGLLKYVLPYKFMLITAGIFAFLFSISNSITIYSVVPIFDTLTGSSKDTVLTISKHEEKLLQKTGLTLAEKVTSIRVKLKQKINAYISSDSKEKILIKISLAIIPLIILRSLFDLIGKFLFSLAGNKAVLNMRNDLFSHIVKLPFTFFHKNRSGELISRLTNDVTPLTSALSTNIYDLIAGIILLATNIIILLYINWKLVLFILIGIPLIYIPIAVMGNLVKRYTRIIQENYADISSHLQETFTGIKVIKSFNMEALEDEKFGIINNKIFTRELRRKIYQNLNSSLVELLGSIAVIGLFLFGGYQIIHGKTTTGEFLFLILIVLNLFEPVKNISEAINGTKAGEAALERIKKIYSSETEDLYTGENGTFTRSIEFKNLSFKYNKENVLNNINIRLPKGKTIGIVGISGSGKSTLLNLITAFYSPSSGEITFDGIPAKDLSLSWIRGKIAYVTQDVFLFHGTILENLACGKDIEMDKVISASKTAHAHEFISGLPNGYDTIVGERGVLLSGGERQRISIARAILADPEIILFDEATSALDSESEKLVQDSLAFLFRNRTSIIVSHRPSTIQYARIVYYIKNGAIADSGTHKELLETSRSYRKLFAI